MTFSRYNNHPYLVSDKSYCSELKKLESIYKKYIKSKYIINKVSDSFIITNLVTKETSDKKLPYIVYIIVDFELFVTF